MNVHGSGVTLGFVNQTFKVILAETVHDLSRFSCDVWLCIGVEDALDVDLSKIRYGRGTRTVYLAPQACRTHTVASRSLAQWP